MVIQGFDEVAAELEAGIVAELRGRV